jgi:RNA polymerase sigma factor (sigma-70 family)
MDDHELLRDYVRNRSQDAFRELVSRHLPMVYSAARRMVRDPQLAEDLAQSAFTLLAQKAGTLEPSAVVGGWLYYTTRNLSLHALRAEQRRREREEAAVSMSALDRGPDETSHVTEHLDSAMAELETEERDVLVLRFLEDRSFATVGRELGISEDAARMRVNRALERLRGVLSRQGVPASAVILTAALAATTSTAVPAGLATVLAAATLTGSFGATTLATATTLTATGVQLGSMFTLKGIALITSAAIIAAGGTYFVQQTKLQQLKASNEQLTASRDQLVAEHEVAMKSLRAASQQPAPLEVDKSELLRLRNEVAQLRRERDSAKQPAVSNPSATRAGATKTVANPGDGYIPKNQLAFVGYATPEAAFQSMTWAMSAGTYEQALAALAPELQKQELGDPKARSSFESGRTNIAPLLKGVEILARKNLAEDRVELKVRTDIDPPSGGQPMPDVMIQPMVKVGDEWKLGGSTRGYQQSWDQEGDIVTLSR